MPRRKTTPPMLKVRVSHEVSRLEKQCMADAFERLLPIVERRLRARPEERGSPREITSRAADNPEEEMGMTAVKRCHLRPRLVRAAGQRQHHRQPDCGPGGPPCAGRPHPHAR